MARPPGRRAATEAEPWRLSAGEIHFLWTFIDGSIMDGGVRTALRRAWGMCQRHSFGFLSVDAAFRSGFLHGPAVLYGDLMQRAVVALRAARVAGNALVARRTRSTGPCYVCLLGYGPWSRGFPSREVLERGSDVSAIHRFSRATMSSWQRWVCGRCAGTKADMRCRLHLRDDLLHGKAALDEQRDRVGELAAHVRRYARSFRWEARGSDTAEDRAALIGAVGWCSGWRIWLDFVAFHAGRASHGPNPGGNAGER